MSKFFSFKLYIEGIKKSRLQGVTICAVTTALTALVPLSRLLYSLGEPKYTPLSDVVSPNAFAIPLGLLLFLTPILTLNLFSFLNKRNESDFYHAIPYTRPCVYFSFLAAVLTWLVITLTVSLSLTTVLWCFAPPASFAVTTPLLVFGAYFLACLLVTAFTLLAMTLTGTVISNLLIFALLFGFVRITGALFIHCLESQFPPMVTALTPGRLLLPGFNLPLLLTSIFSYKGATAYENFPLWIYTAIVSVLLIAVGCILYTKRRSEMANKSAPTPILQHVYRCAVTLPMAFLIAYYIIQVGFKTNTLLFLVVLTLIVYYVYEILTTKRLKNCLKATLFLPVLVVGGLMFGGGVTIASNAAANYAPAADELQSVRIYYNISKHSNVSYNEYKTKALEISDPETLQFVAEKLAEMKDTVSKKGASEYLYPFSYSYDDKVNYADTITLKITEKSGRVCGRTFRLTEEDYERLVACFTESKEYEEALIALPTEKEILKLSVCGIETEEETIWRCFANEYNALSKGQKLEYQAMSRYTRSLFAVEVHGSIGTQSFSESYRLTPQYLPQTCKLAIEIANQENEYGFQKILNTIRANESAELDGTLSTIFKDDISFVRLGRTCLKAVEFAESCQTSFDDDAILFCLTFNYNDMDCQRYYMLSEEDFYTVCQLLVVKDLYQYRQ